MAHASLGEPAGPSSSTAAADDAAGGMARSEKVERDLAGLVEEAAAGMPRLMAAMPGPGTGGAQAQDAQEAMVCGCAVVSRSPTPKYSSGFHGRGTAKQGNDRSDRQEAIAKRRSVSARP
jgi:hypothetical protein